MSLPVQIRYGPSRKPWEATRFTECYIKIITYDRFKPGVTLATISPYLVEEVSNVWRLWKAGIVRENYARADEAGVVIVFECESVEVCKSYTDNFPLTKAGLIEWFHIPVQVALPIESLFRPEIDVESPYDRTMCSSATTRAVQCVTQPREVTAMIGDP